MKNEPTCSTSLKKIHLFFVKISWSFFIVVIVQPIFIFRVYSFQIAPVVSEDPLLQKFGADCICHHTSWLLLSFNLIMMCGFCGKAGLSGRCGK